MTTTFVFPGGSLSFTDASANPDITINVPSEAVARAMRDAMAGTPPPLVTSTPVAPAAIGAFGATAFVDPTGRVRLNGTVQSPVRAPRMIAVTPGEQAARKDQADAELRARVAEVELAGNAREATAVRERAELVAQEPWKKYLVLALLAIVGTVAAFVAYNIAKPAAPAASSATTVLAAPAMIDCGNGLSAKDVATCMKTVAPAPPAAASSSTLMNCGPWVPAGQACLNSTPAPVAAPVPPAAPSGSGTVTVKAPAAPALPSCSDKEAAVKAAVLAACEKRYPSSKVTDCSAAALQGAYDAARDAYVVPGVSCNAK